MALVSPSAGKAEVRETASGLEIAVPAPRHLFIMLFLPIWLIGWAFGFVSALAEITSGSGTGPELFLIVWLTMWTLGGGAALVTFLWMLGGKQIIRVERNQLSIRWDLFGLGFSREYDAAHIARLRIGEARGFNAFDMARAGDFWGISGGLLVFDYGARTIRFGLGMHEAEASALLPRIVRALPAPHAG